jgi:hypothetical protein
VTSAEGSRIISSLWADPEGGERAVAEQHRQREKVGVYSESRSRKLYGIGPRNANSRAAANPMTARVNASRHVLNPGALGPSR